MTAMIIQPGAAGVVNTCITNVSGLSVQRCCMPLVEALGCFVFNLGPRHHHSRGFLTRPSK